MRQCFPEELGQGAERVWPLFGFSWGRGLLSVLSRAVSVVSNHPVQGGCKVGVDLGAGPLLT